jgi:hypothetical protein
LYQDSSFTEGSVNMDIMLVLSLFHLSVAKMGLHVHHYLSPIPPWTNVILHWLITLSLRQLLLVPFGSSTAMELSTLLKYYLPSSSSSGLSH